MIRGSRVYSGRRGRPSPVCWRSLATRPVQPVWWEAPIPAPSSPLKYSWKRRRSFQWGPSGRPPVPPYAGRRPSGPARKIRVRRRESSSATCQRVDLASGALRKLHRERVAEEVVELLERLDEEEVHGKPDRSPPVRVAPEEAGPRLGGLVVDAQLAAVPRHDEGALAVRLREGPDPVVGQEAVRVEDLLEDAPEAVPPDEGEEPARARGRSSASRPWHRTPSRGRGTTASGGGTPGTPRACKGSSVATAKSGNEADHGLDPHRDRVAVGEAQDVVEEAVRLVPEAGAALRARSSPSRCT